MNKKELKNLIFGTLVLSVTLVTTIIYTHKARTSSLAAAGFQLDLFNDHINPCLPPLRDMITGRYDHTATKLPDGRVLVAGGRGYHFNPLDKAEIFDPTNNSWTAVPNMSRPRFGHDAVLLIDGRVLVAGGDNSGTAEIYDPNANNWSPIPDMQTVRKSPTLTLLLDGRVLMVGGEIAPSLNYQEIYDPVSNSWKYTKPSKYSHNLHNATLLTDGRVLVTAGGIGTSTNHVEIYDPTTNSWTFTDDMQETRYNNPAVLLNNGNVLQVSGEYNTNNAEYYDPTAGKWFLTGFMSRARLNHTATLLNNGDVLVIGGGLAPYNSVSIERYTPSTNNWTPDIPLGTVRARHTATLLNNGNVLIAGGTGGNNRALNSVELYGQNTPVLIISHRIGKPTSYFMVWGYGFTPNNTASLFINNFNLGPITIDNTGYFKIQLNTAIATEGAYIVTVQAPAPSPFNSTMSLSKGQSPTEQASIIFYVNSTAPNTWPYEPGAPPIMVPYDIALDETLYLPILTK